ncbi:MAG: HAD-IIA family hydrolase [Chloroflexi bacterium]|nr:HAD-IIA family hydrolase [Chloroflexota bacterium]
MTAWNPRAIQGLILDMDGVLWRGGQPLGPLPEWFARMRALGLRWVFVTNNATRSPRAYVERLRGLGVPAREEQIINSAMAAAALLKTRWPQAEARVLTLGEGGLDEVLSQAGFSITHEPPADVVVAALDRQCTYEKLARAARAVHQGAWLVGTNPDRTYPVPEGLAPGAGALLAALEAATDAQATIAGKPEPWPFRLALQRLGLPPERVLAVGDRLETDILGAQRLGIPTALVLSGVTTREQALAWEPPPNWMGEDLGRLLAYLEMVCRGPRALAPDAGDGGEGGP